MLIAHTFQIYLFGLVRKTKFRIPRGGEVVRKSCKWTENSDGVYETECDQAFEFIAGYLQENKFRFCPYCGGKIKVMK